MFKMLRPMFAVLLVSVVSAFSFAQNAVLPVTPVAAYEIGFDCPLASALDPSGEVLWVLMRGCARGENSLQAFSAADGTLLNPDNDYAEQVAGIGRYSTIDSGTNPMTFLPDGRLSIRYSAEETYETVTLTLDVGVETGQTAPVTLDDAALNALLSEYTEYPETTVYTGDRTLAVVTGEAAFHILDMTTGAELFNIQPDTEIYASLPSVSPDGRTLYLATFDEPENMENYNATLTRYSLPDGTPIEGSAALPSAFMWVSPDGRYAAVTLGSNDGTYEGLIVTDLTDGSTSDAFPLYEPSAPLLKCANDGRDMSDVDFKVSGRLHLVGLSWLPDSSGFLFTRSYGGEGAGGGRPCYFNTSRLNRFAVGGGD